MTGKNIQPTASVSGVEIDGLAEEIEQYVLEHLRTVKITAHFANRNYVLMGTEHDIFSIDIVDDGFIVVSDDKRKFCDTLPSVVDYIEKVWGNEEEIIPLKFKTQRDEELFNDLSEEVRSFVKQIIEIDGGTGNPEIEMTDTKLITFISCYFDNTIFGHTIEFIVNHLPKIVELDAISKAKNRVELILSIYKGDESE